MTKKIITYLFVLGIFFISSCSEKLEIDPQQSVDDQSAFTSVNMLENAITGTYDAIQGGNLFGYATIALNDLKTQHVWYTGSYIAERAISIKEITTANTAVTSLWTEGYACINATNRILYAIENGIDDPLFNSIQDRATGEAYFIRALVYFELIRNFAKPYNTANMNSPGVPLVLTPTFDLDDATKPERASIDEVYQQIIDDFEMAYNLLPETAIGEGRANSACAAAYLARVYSYMADWDKVIEWTEGLSVSAAYSLDIDPASTFGENFTSEMIFGIVNTSTDNVDVHPRWLYSPYNRAEISIPQATYELYDTINDLRILNTTFKLNGKRWLNKYIEDKDNIPLMRIADIYLVRAEALASLAAPTTTQLNESLDLLNLIRVRAGLSGYTSLTQSELLDRIKEETIKEFIGEGHIFFDLVRWGDQIGYSSGQGGFINWDDPRNVYPIPQREMDVNENLVQNEGY